VCGVKIVPRLSNITKRKLADADPEIRVFFLEGKLRTCLKTFGSFILPPITQNSKNLLPPMSTMTTKGYLGIDNGTQGLSIVFTDEKLNVLATGEGHYDFVPNLPEGCFEQRTQDWDAALQVAMQSVKKQITDMEVLAIGIAGQMHGEVLVGETEALSPVRLWCDARNEAEGHELTKLFGVKVAKRATAARFLWTCRHHPKLASQVHHLTTPAGWLSYRLTGEWNLGIGDAAGIFPVDNTTMNYNERLLDMFDELVDNPNIPSLRSILPSIRRAGQDAGSLDETGASLLGLPTGIPVASAEGDQVAALAGSLIGRPGMLSCCFGTSVCANAVGDRNFQGVSSAVDHFCAADGKPINMVWLRNGTTFLNTMVESYASSGSKQEAFTSSMPEMLAAPPDCGGLLALPFMNDEPGLHVVSGGSALVMGWTPENAKPGNVAKAALLSTMFNLKLNCGVLKEQGYPMTEIVLTGGLTKTPECGQILADVFDLPVRLFESAEEGCSWGAAVMAQYRHRQALGDQRDWLTFLDSIVTEGRQQQFQPNAAAVGTYEKVFERYQKLMALQPQLTAIMNQ